MDTGIGEPTRPAGDTQASAPTLLDCCKRYIRMQEEVCKEMGRKPTHTMYWMMKEAVAQEEKEPSSTERTCLICGCTDSKACEGGCSWINSLGDICSKCITEAVPECIDLLIETILLIHQDEIDHQHHGDDTCSTCDLIGLARRIEKALRE